MCFTSIFQSSARSASAAALAILGLGLLLSRPAAAATCPHVLFLESTNGKYYVAVFAAPVTMKSSLDITLYSKSSAYFTSLAQISIEKPWNRSDAEQGFRSYTVLFANPGDDPLLGALVRPYGLQNDTVCPPEEHLIPSIADVRTPPVPPSPAEAALEKDVAGEAGDGSNALPLTPVPLPPGFPCDVPFAAAKIVKGASLEIDRQTNSLATDALVDLSASGAVTNVTVSKSSGNLDFDREVVAVARKTTYTSMIFACIARNGRFPFHGQVNVNSGTVHNPAS